MKTDQMEVYDDKDSWFGYNHFHIHDWLNYICLYKTPVLTKQFTINPIP
ncbi:hypothetical protein [Paenibacillus sp. LPE1-1-1.1]